MSQENPLHQNGQTGGTDRPSPQKRFLRITGISCVLVAVAVFGAHAFYVNWYLFVQCGGAGTNHSDGTNPDTEQVTNSAQESVSQCHGAPGETGSCYPSQSNPNNFNVGCLVKANGDELCFASYQCGGSEGTISCGGSGQEAFAGEASEQGGGKYGFVLCREAGTQNILGSHACNQ